MSIEVNSKIELSMPVYENLRSETMSEFISRRKGFLANWGIVIFLVILVVLASIAWFVHYPDLIVTRATIIAADKPREIMTHGEGRLVKLFVQNDAEVQKGIILGFMESNAKHEDILLLEKLLDSSSNILQTDQLEGLFYGFAANSFSLGELQHNYQRFISALQQYSSYIGEGYYIRKLYTLKEDIAWLQKSRAVIQRQKSLLEKDVRLSEENYEMNARLLREKVISKQDERNEQSKLLGKQLTIPQVEASLLLNETQQREKLKEIAELEHGISQQKILFEQQLQSLRNDVKEWVDDYILIAPISGRIGFILPLQDNSFFPSNKVLAYVNPLSSSYYAEINLPQDNFGKVERGQQVQLRFDAYPYNEFGHVIAKLSYVSEFATDSGFLAHLQLPEGLVTSRQKTLQYHSGLQADARIVTKDMRLVDRLYGNLRQIFEH